MAPPPSTFSLSSLFLVTTLAAVSAGAFAAATALGVLFLFIACPALVRTIVVVSRRTVLGRASTSLEKLAVFVGSVHLVLLFFSSIALVLIAGWWTAGMASAALRSAGEGPEIAGFFVGAVVGLALSSWGLWRVWHAGKRPLR